MSRCWGFITARPTPAWPLTSKKRRCPNLFRATMSIPCPLAFCTWAISVYPFRVSDRMAALSAAIPTARLPGVNRASAFEASYPGSRARRGSPLIYPNGVASIGGDGRNPVGVARGHASHLRYPGQLATLAALGWKTQPPWGCRKLSVKMRHEVGVERERSASPRGRRSCAGRERKAGLPAPAARLAFPVVLFQQVVKDQLGLARRFIELGERMFQRQQAQAKDLRNHPFLGLALIPAVRGSGLNLHSCSYQNQIRRDGPRSSALRLPGSPALWPERSPAGLHSRFP